jgi:hypothetical protein
MDSVRSKEDIVSLHNGREWATFDGGVETMIGQIDRVLQKVFRTKKPPLQVRVTLERYMLGVSSQSWTEILPHSGAPRKDRKRIHIFLQQLAH